MNRAATRWSAAPSESQAGTHGGRSDSFVVGGSRPMACCRAKVASRQASHPASNAAAVAVEPPPGRLVRRMARAGGEVEEERLVGCGRAQLAHVADGAVGQVLAEVVAVGGRAGRHDRVVVLEQRRHELVGLATMEAIPTLEAATARPRVTRGCHVRLVLGREMPLADRHRQVTVGREDLGQHAVLTRDDDRSNRGSRRPGRRLCPCRSNGGCGR